MEKSNHSILESLEKLRLRLLDLTSRNRLINFSHTKKGSLRVIDELPNQLVQTLLSDSKMNFLPIPEPTQQQLVDAGYLEIDEETGQEKRLKPDPSATEWAKHLGLSTSYEVPIENQQTSAETRHNDTAIQTLLYPYELESRLKGIMQTSESAIQEMGSNILYLAVGFLEWFDSHQGKARIAPLFLVPLKLNKGQLNQENKTYEYTLEYSGEDIIPNLSLREKLKQDFAMALPDLDENTEPETYFNDVTALIKDTQPKWSLRRYISVTLLNFSKMLMYLDLDPNNWPEDNNIIEHPVVSQFLGGDNENQTTDHLAFGEEYPIDEIENMHSKYPLIDDADSSQHSALIDAINGKSLVIEGPPGTGKSQTITNLIGAAIAQGKRVLFVAEKLAALEVVKRRLDNANLGEFCLELHSHKSQKRQVIEEINDRLSKSGSYRSPQALAADITRYEELKDELKKHVERINRQWKQTGLSAHEILMSATRYREELTLNPRDFHPEKLNGDSFTPILQRKTLDQVKAYTTAYKAVIAQLDKDSGLYNHPWYGVTNANLQIFDLDEIIVALNDWQTSLSQLEHKWNVVSDTVKLESSFASLEGVSLLLASLKRVPKLQGNEALEMLPTLRDQGLIQARKEFDLFERIEHEYKSLSQYVSDNVLNDLSSVETLLSGSQQLKALVDPNVRLGTLAKAAQRLTSIIKEVTQLEEPISHLQATIGNHAKDFLSSSASGLDEFRILTEFVAYLSPSSLPHRDPLFENDELDLLLPALSKQLNKLQQLRIELKEVFDPETLPTTEYLVSLNDTLNTGGIFRWFSSKWRLARKEVLNNTNKSLSLNQVQLHLIKAIEFSKLIQDFKENNTYRVALGKHFKAMDTNVEMLIELREWYKKVRAHYGIGFGPKVIIGDAIINLSINDCKGIISLHDRGVSQQISKILDDLSSLKKIFKPVQPLQNDKTLLTGESGSLSQLVTALNNSLTFCKPLLTNELTVTQLCEQIVSLDALNKDITHWTQAKLAGTIFNDKDQLEVGVNIDNTTAKSTVKNTLLVAEKIQHDIKLQQVKQLLYEQPYQETFQMLSDLYDQVLTASINQLNSSKRFEELVKLQPLEWMNECNGDIGKIKVKNDLALKHPNALQNWLDYVRVRDQLIAMGLSSIASNTENNNINIEQVELAYYAGTYDLLAREILYEQPELGRFSGRSQEALQTQFQDYDNKLKSLQREQIAWKVDQNEVPKGSSGARVSEYSERFLLELECNKRARHIPIRQLIRRAGQALVGLKPCFMMGPMSVAQYLAPGQIKFDLIIMDEASQIKPQDALGVIARGEQLVVVGDPKQLPPTNFFDKLMDDDDDPTALQESESILDATLPMFPARRLRWHYRSQHESLIAFSNQAFYNQDLVIFPSPNKASSNFGIQYSRIIHGCFVNRRNMEEAKIIAEAVREHFKNSKGETLGVVAMSADQRQQIERAIEVLAKNDSAFQHWLEEDSHRNESLFVKNLENVQGDERDVIFISMTYGPSEPGGKVFQRFGPINSDLGWRRLNVLFTRSKKRMHIFSSMSSDDIVITHNSKRGVLALRDFLSYCETGLLHNTVRESGRAPDSDFEVAVMDALANEGFECIPQVGVAGFFIDIAVVDPGNPGKYLMGIECDGATYHSAKSTRDRDRLRQTILERLGWKICRIWSTDWFKNPRAELKPIIRQLHELKSLPVEEFELEAEVDEINEIIEGIEEQEIVTQNFISEASSLRDRLIEYDAKILHPAFPNTPENQRLLRPAMLEALLEFQPINNEEFLEYIPGYLRQATCASQGQYLDKIFEIINASL